MKTYLVGGAVRDALLGLPVSDRDHVVVGATPAQMLDAGYVAVGRDFPVFLHPQTREEYALARTERNSGPGYRGFVVDSDPSVTLEQDLERRDLTINAMAQRENGDIVDPWGGREDLESRRLRHVSKAFVEDPVRILRVARFMARFEPLGFAIATETLELMRSMVDAGEVSALVPERVWQELEGALGALRPRAFVESLRTCGALAIVMPELDALFGEHRGRGDRTLAVLDRVAQRCAEVDVRFAALCHDLGGDDGDSPAAASDPLAALCERLRVPKLNRDLAVMVNRWQAQCRVAESLDATSIAAMLQALDVVRRPERFERFLETCSGIADVLDGPATPSGAVADENGGPAPMPAPMPIAEHGHAGVERIRAAARAWTSVDAGATAAATSPKSAVPEAILSARFAALDRVIGATAPVRRTC